MSDSEREAGYIEGRRRSLINMLGLVLREISGEDYESSPEKALIELAKLIREREEAIASARQVCNRFELPNDWPDDLRLADVIEKRIVEALDVEEP